MFINTKILSLITLLLFSGAVYGIYNYWQSNVPPKQTFLLQGFEQTLGVVDKEVEEKNKEGVEYFKALVEKHKRGMDLLEQITKVRVLTKALRVSLDTLFALKTVSTQQIETKCLAYKKQLLVLYRDADDRKSLSTYMDLLLNLEALTLPSKDFVPTYQQLVQLNISALEYEALTIFSAKFNPHNYQSYWCQIAVEPNAQQLNIGDTLQLKIYSSLFQSSYPRYCFNFEDKSLETERDGTARYKTVCNKVGRYSLKGFVQAVDNEYIPDIPFEMPYTVEACR